MTGFQHVRFGLRRLGSGWLVIAQRTHEIGLRIAFDASSDHILGLVLKEGLALAGSGLCLGLVDAFCVGRALRDLLYGVGFIDGLALCTVSLTCSPRRFSPVTFPRGESRSGGNAVLRMKIGCVSNV